MNRLFDVVRNRNFFEGIMYLNFFLPGSFSFMGRAVAGSLIGGICSVFLSWLFIKYGNRFIRSGVREFVTDLHAHKDKTPTMGGVPAFFAFFCALLFTGVLTSPQVLPVVVAFFCFGALGFWDDLCKIRRGRGITDRAKFIGQLSIASGLVTWLLAQDLVSPVLVVPFFGAHSWPIGLFFIPWALFIIVGTNNAVNITDGLDGLAASLLIVNFFACGVIALFAGNFDLMIAAVAMCGVLAGFLWYNAHPAQLFMGDVGSLGFGGVLVTTVLLLKAESLLPFMGIIFVVETLSVMAQVLSVRYRKKRLFKMAPFHHHLELIGVPETRIVARFFLVTLFVTILILGLTLRYLSAA